MFVVGISRSSSFLILAAVLVNTTGCISHGGGQAPRPLGSLIDLGGYRIHVSCLGAGSPAVVMESGAGDFSFDWALVKPKVARSTRVCSYDRAGYAWSDSGPTPRTMRQIATELNLALERAGVEPPYVLVGHSLGGLTVRTFSELYPAEVAGVVLVDSSHEDQSIIIINRTSHAEKLVRWRDLASGRSIPPVRVVAPPPSTTSDEMHATNAQREAVLEKPYSKLPRRVQEYRRWATSLPAYDAARSSETFDFLADELALLFSARASREHPLGAKPLIVLTRGIPNEDEQRFPELAREHDRLQQDLLNLSMNSDQVIARASGHHVHLDEPTLVAKSIRRVVEAVRHKSMLK